MFAKVTAEQYLVYVCHYQCMHLLTVIYHSRFECFYSILCLSSIYLNELVFGYSTLNVCMNSPNAENEKNVPSKTLTRTTKVKTLN